MSILKELYHEVYTTPEIAHEYGKELPLWVNIKTAANKALYQRYLKRVDKGEASAIALALEMPAPILVPDDLAARKLAEELQLNYTGTLGVLITAKQRGVIQKLKPYFDLIKTTNFRVADQLLQTLLDKYDI